MADTDLIRAALNADYQRDRFTGLLDSIFNDGATRLTWLPAPVDMPLTTASGQHRAKRLTELGEIELDDKRRIRVFEGEVHNTRIADNRRGLQELIKDKLVPNEKDGVFAAFYASDQAEWRFTFVSRWEFPDEASGKLVEHKTHHKRFTYVLGANESCRTAIERFAELAGKPKDLRHVALAFSVSRISTEFFKEYNTHYKAFTEHLAGTEELRAVFGIPKLKDKAVNFAAEKPIRDFTKKLLGRIVFLYFLQKKGWIGAPDDDGSWSQGSRRFLSELFEQSDRESDFYQKYLCELFFHTLNTDAEKRPGLLYKVGRKSFGKVPYLNGGLFDKDFDQVEALSFPRRLWQELFAFFDGYNFTIIEDSPEEREIAVDPELLGHVFEQLIDENEKKKKGTYYTPKEVVHFMAHESLVLYLRTSMGLKDSDTDALKALDEFVRFKDISRWVQQNARRMDALLDSVKICDPAIGSGAFPMGMLLEIYQLKRHLYSLIDPLGNAKPFVPIEVKENIIRNSIYGVDLDKGAIDIASLRFWLSLIVEANEPRPLPNLDYKFMQGNSLREEFRGIPLHIERERKQVQVFDKDLFGNAVRAQLSIIDVLKDKAGNVIDVLNLKEKLFDSHDPEEKRAIHQDLDRAERQVLQFAIEALTSDLERELEKLEDTFKKDSRQVSAAQRRRLEEKLRTKSAPIQQRLSFVKDTGTELAAMDPYEKQWFLWHLYFGDVLDAGGFDIVVANPPYVEDTEFADVKDRLGLGSCDLYGLFTSLALQKLVRQESGVVVFITSDTWLTIGSHKELRKQVLGRELRTVARLHADTFDATVNSCIFSVVNRPLPPPPWWSYHHEKLLPMRKAHARAKAIADAERAERAKKNASVVMEPGDADAHLEKQLSQCEAEYATLIKDWKPDGHAILAADLTNLSTRKELPEFREKLYHLPRYVGDYTTGYAVYRYPQQLICTSSHLPIFTASPKLFGLMNDMTCATVPRTIGGKQVQVRLVPMNGETVELVRFGDLAEVNQGLATGDNDAYLFQVATARGTYRDIDNFRQFLLTDADLEKIRGNEALRQRVVAKGIHKSKDEKGFEKDRWFGGRYIIPYDKGGEAKTSEGFLPNYHVPTEYFIDWSTWAVHRMLTLTTKQRNRLNGKTGGDDKLCSRFQNSDSYFLSSITCSRVGKYSPTYRWASDTVYDSGCNNIFCDTYPKEDLIALLASKMWRFKFIEFVNHTVNSQTDDNDMLPLIAPGAYSFSKPVGAIVAKQKEDRYYKYMEAEQKIIDAMIFDLYHLSMEDVQEIETWWARRYPALARFADVRPHIKRADHAEQEKRSRDAIAQGENKYVEFKSSLRWDVRHNQVNKGLEHEVAKTLSAFLNSEGGTLFMGVNDKGEVLGLETTDYKGIGGKEVKWDAWQLQFDNVVKNYLGDAVQGLMERPIPVELDGRTVVAVTVKGRFAQPVMLKNGDQEEFWIRRSASSTRLGVKDAVAYIKQVWG